MNPSSNSPHAGKKSNNEQHPAFGLVDVAQVDAVAGLLSKGLDPNLRSCADGPTLLMHAAVTGSVEMVDRLIAAGADVNAVDRTGESALVRVARVGREPMVKALLERGADANLRAPTGNALFWAEERGDEAMSELLRTHGAERDEPFVPEEDGSELLYPDACSAEDPIAGFREVVSNDLERSCYRAITGAEPFERFTRSLQDAQLLVLSLVKEPAGGVTPLILEVGDSPAVLAFSSEARARDFLQNRTLPRLDGQLALIKALGHEIVEKLGGDVHLQLNDPATSCSFLLRRGE